jgi:hypothetical protein
LLDQQLSYVCVGPDGFCLQDWYERSMYDSGRLQPSPIFDAWLLVDEVSPSCASEL